MPDINPYEILDTLGIARCGAARRVQGGWDTTIWRVTCEHGEYALRLFREGTDRWADREHQIMQSVADTGVNLPQVHAYGTWNGRRAMLLSWCPGRPLLEGLRSKPWNIRKLGYAMGRRQAEMHQVEIEIPGISPDDWMTVFGPLDNGLRERLTSMDLRQGRLLHMDYHPMNIMVEAGEIGAILDWNNAATGDPRADVARTWSMLRLMPLSSNRPAILTERSRHFLAAGWLRGYQETAGPLGNIDVFKLWAAQAMVNDLRRQVDNPDSWFEQHHLDTIQQRVDQLRRQLGMR